MLVVWGWVLPKVWLASGLPGDFQPWSLLTGLGRVVATVGTQEKYFGRCARPHGIAGRIVVGTRVRDRRGYSIGRARVGVPSVRASERQRYRCAASSGADVDGTSTDGVGVKR